MKTKATSSTTPSNNNPFLAQGKKIPIPNNLLPMLATLTDKPFDNAGWLYEVKWDGYRALAFLNNGTVELKSRNNKSFNEKFYPVTKALTALYINAVLDGEIVVVNKKGVPDFSDLQKWRSEADGQLIFYAFDVLWLDGYSLMELPLVERRAVLQKVFQQNDLIKVSDNLSGSANDFFKLADSMGLEGIMAKKAESTYQPGVRTKDWLKIKTEKRQEAVIGGYTRNEGTSRPFSALLLGLYHGNQFHSLGTVGTGFTMQFQRELLGKLRPLEIAACPFVTMPEFNKPSRFRPNPPKAEVTWVNPEVVCEITYREMTKDGAIRHPSFKALREDKNALEVVLEKPVPMDLATKKKNMLAQQKVLNAPGKKERNSLLNPTEQSQVKRFGGHDLKFTNLSKVYWPEEGVTKRDLLNYYYQVAPYILPYIQDRPQTLNRYPNGILGKTFYQKDVKGKAPEWINTFPYHSYADGKDKEFLVCTNEASLLYIAAMGCIEINPWSSRVQTPDHPDWCIIDLDPDKNTFEQVIEAACVTKEILDAIGVTAFPKTSGSTGLHIYIPLGAKYTYEQSKEFGRVIAKLVHGQLPGFTSIERKVADRGGKMYIDFLQNRPQATVAAPYSLRPKPGAPVSMPLHWIEVKKGLQIKDYTIFNALERIKEQGDLFKGVLGKGIDMEKVSITIERLFTA
jgi:bifunctional non-homologous end joining protein LigD